MQIVALHTRAYRNILMKRARIESSDVVWTCLGFVFGAGTVFIAWPNWIAILVGGVFGALAEISGVIALKYAERRYRKKTRDR